MKLENLKTEFGAIKSFEQVITTPCCSFAYVAREKGEEATRDLVALIIAQFVDSVNVGQTLNNTQIMVLAEDILEDHRTLKISDLMLFFKFVRRGKYGELYNTLSPEKIFTWLNSYFDERCEFSANRSVREADKFKETSIMELSYQQTVKTSDGFKKIIKKIVKRV